MKNKQASIPREELEKIYLMYSMNQFHDAIKCIKILNEKFPNQSLLFNLIGACYKEIGQLDGAVQMFRIAVSINPKYAEAFFNLGATLQALDQKDDAVENYQKALDITPNYPDAHNNLGNTLLDLGKIDSAIESLEWAVAYKHDFAEAYNNLGNAYNDSGKPDKAIENFKKAISCNPSYEKAIFNLALVFKDLGNREEFVENIEKALTLNPSWGHAHYHLSRVKSYKKNDPQIDQIKQALESENLNSIDLIGLNFALSKVYEDLENHKEQFKFLNEANSLRKKELNYSIERDQKLFLRIKETFKIPPSIFNSSEIKTKPNKPIFIVGMPRSGTSLVHQILDSHSEVKGLGELNNLNKFVVPLLKSFNHDFKECFSKKELLLLRDEYLNSLPISDINENIIVDKMPLNFRYIGFILSCFPDAKVIHMNRDPMATCWSIYKYEFRGNAYSFNQEDIASYYGLYSDLMGFWKDLFPGKIYDLCYEDLTSNQEEETQALLRYCELEWDDKCLNFHNNKTSVKTTSSMQVRKKMYQGSSEAWKKYEIYLKPLIKGLNLYY
ncbi:sulfotransferase [Candidatus Pseudothioglobus singularis]|nr:sulfotransferase [Candidatus Pseudothioglobus singularis]